MLIGAAIATASYVQAELLRKKSRISFRGKPLRWLDGMPSTPKEGDTYLDNATCTVKVFTGRRWIPLEHPFALPDYMTFGRKTWEHAPRKCFYCGQEKERKRCSDCGAKEDAPTSTTKQDYLEMVKAIDQARMTHREEWS